MTTYYTKIGKEDLRLFDGNNRTFQRRNSSGSLIDLHTMGNVVDVLQAFGDGTTPTHSDLTDAIVGANGNECALELAPGTWPVTSNLTIPSTVTLILLRGASFSVSVGVTLTLSGPVIAQESTWYAGAGTVVYTAGGGYFPLVSDLASVDAGKGASLIGATGTAKTVGDLFDGGKDVTIKPLNVDAGGTLDVAGASTLAVATATDLSASGTLGGKLAFRGALVCLGANQSITSGIPTFVSFVAETYDTSSIHDNSTNPSRFTVPTGVSRVKLKAQIIWGSDTNGVRSATVFKNNSENYAGRPSIQISPPNVTPSIYLESPVLTVTEGDYFELSAYHTAGSPVDLVGDANGRYTWFTMEIVE